MPGLQAVDTALDRTAARLTTFIQKHAAESGWPKEAAAGLQMTRTQHGTLALGFNGLTEEAEDLEYGTQDRAPIPVLTVFDSASGKQMVKKTTLDSMDEIHDRIQGLFS